MRVLVTGAAGFNGGSLIPELLAARALLGFTATISPDEMIDEANAWIRAERATGDIDAGGRPRSPAGSSAR